MGAGRSGTQRWDAFYETNHYRKTLLITEIPGDLVGRQETSLACQRTSAARLRHTQTAERHKLSRGMACARTCTPRSHRHRLLGQDMLHCAVELNGVFQVPI